MQPAVLKDVLLDIVMFPVWWYSRGLLLCLRWSVATFQSYAKYFAVTLWMQNLFVPMFGQTDWQSRLISIFMRSVQIVGRSLALAMVTTGLVVALAAYMAGPILLALFTLYHGLGTWLYAF